MPLSDRFLASFGDFAVSPRLRRLGSIVWVIQFDLQNVNLFEFWVKNTGDSYSLSFEAVDQVGAIEAEDVISGRQDQIASHVLNAVHGAGIGGNIAEVTFVSTAAESGFLSATVLTNCRPPRLTC
jgi:hypothetical protein